MVEISIKEIDKCSKLGAFGVYAFLFQVDKCSKHLQNINVEKLDNKQKLITKAIQRQDEEHIKKIMKDRSLCNAKNKE